MIPSLDFSFVSPPKGGVVVVVVVEEVVVGAVVVVAGAWVVDAGVVVDAGRLVVVEEAAVVDVGDVVAAIPSSSPEVNRITMSTMTRPTIRPPSPARTAVRLRLSRGGGAGGAGCIV